VELFDPPRGGVGNVSDTERETTMRSRTVGGFDSMIVPFWEDPCPFCGSLAQMLWKFGISRGCVGGVIECLCCGAMNAVSNSYLEDGKKLWTKSLESYAKDLKPLILYQSKRHPTPSARRKT
jgi:hypothetical protein